MQINFSTFLKGILNYPTVQIEMFRSQNYYMKLSVENKLNSKCQVKIYRSNFAMIQCAQNEEHRLGHFNWCVVYPESNHKTILHLYTIQFKSFGTSYLLSSSQLVPKVFKLHCMSLVEIKIIASLLLSLPPKIYNQRSNLEH